MNNEAETPRTSEGPISGEVAQAPPSVPTLDMMRRFWDALAAAGCQPRGEVFRFRARCPVHEGTNTDTLEVYEGVDRRVVFGCYAHRCDKGAILSAIGLSWRDLFPPGHRNAARPYPQRPVKPRALSEGSALLDLLTVAGFEWSARLFDTRCPFCDDPHAYLTIHDRGGLDVSCSAGCTSTEVRQAIVTRAAIAEHGVAL